MGKLNFSENKKINFIVSAIFLACVLAGILLLVPAVQTLGIKIGEMLAGRELRDYAKWHREMTRGGIVLLILDVLFLMTYCLRDFICHLSQLILAKLENNYKIKIFLFVYAFLFFLNFIFPTQSDDIGRKIGTITQLLNSYNKWNARIGELLLLLLGSWLSTTPAYAFINALVGCVVIFDFFILFFGRFPQATQFDICAIAIEIIWLLIDSCFGSIFFWAAGSFNYLWAYAFILTWLLPFRFLFAEIIAVRQIKEIDCIFNKSNFIKTVVLFILGIFAGWSQELGIVFFLLTLGSVPKYQLQW